jgi:hypothetical protein
MKHLLYLGLLATVIVGLSARKASAQFPGFPLIDSAVINVHANTLTM